MDDDKQLDSAVVYYQHGHYDRAIRILNSLEDTYLSLTPAFVKSLRKKAGMYTNYPDVEPIHPKLGVLLDSRAATYEKMGEIDRAFKDANTLTIKDPLSCKGWLRLGRLLQRQNEPGQALHELEKGMATIKAAFKQYKIKPPPTMYQKLRDEIAALRRYIGQPVLKDRAQSQVDRSKDIMPVEHMSKRPRKVSNDPFLALPLEVLELIFQYLNTREVLQCHRVCKLWYRSLTQLASLYLASCKSRVSYGQFESGMRLLKRINGNRRQIRGLQIKSPDNLERVLRFMCQEPGLFIQSLELADRRLSWSGWLNLWSNSGWMRANFARLNRISLALNSSFDYESVFLSLFPQVKEVQIVVFTPEMTSPPPKDKIFTRMNTSSEKAIGLTKLALINHPKLNRSSLRMRPGPTTFAAQIPFLGRKCPQLTKLTIANHDFENILPSFGEYLLHTSMLESLYLENNLEFTFFDFLQLLKNYNPEFKLKSLTFRERTLNSPASLAEFGRGDLPQLRNLTHLDIYGSSLTTPGFKRLLTLVGSHLTYLEMGNCANVTWPRDIVGIRPGSLLHFDSLFKLAPKLSSLGLRESEIDNYTLNRLACSKREHSLEYLDLSFCLHVNGRGILELIRFPVVSVRIDGVDISQDTLEHTRALNPTMQNLYSDPRATNWRNFGANTWVQPV
ncbi:hypothetical protein DICA1_E22056 [Diutina catenulata]